MDRAPVPDHAFLCSNQCTQVTMFQIFAVIIKKQQQQGIHLIRQILIETQIFFLNLSSEDLPILYSPYRPLKS